MESPDTIASHHQITNPGFLQLHRRDEQKKESPFDRDIGRYTAITTVATKIAAN